jgi:hypothetical protein
MLQRIHVIAFVNSSLFLQCLFMLRNYLLIYSITAYIYVYSVVDANYAMIVSLFWCPHPSRRGLPPSLYVTLYASMLPNIQMARLSNHLLVYAIPCFHRALLFASILPNYLLRPYTVIPQSFT